MGIYMIMIYLFIHNPSLIDFIRNIKDFLRLVTYVISSINSEKILVSSY